MLDGEEFPTGSVSLAEALHTHLLEVAAAKIAGKPEGVATSLPGALDLLKGIERAAVDALTENPRRRIDTARPSIDMMRRAAAPYISASWSPPMDPTGVHFSAATRGMIEGTVIDLGRLAED